MRAGYRWPRMELRHLRYFVAVAEEQNVTRAAARLHVSQPPLTRQIHDLEDELGFPLFDRTGKALRLTDAGRAFLVEVRAVLARLEAGIATARALATGGGELHLGYAPSPTAGFLPSALREFRRRIPGARVTLHEHSSPEMIAGLREGRLHAALMMEPPASVSAGIEFEALRTQAMLVAVPPAHAFARRRTVTLPDLMKQPILVLSRAQFPDYHALLARLLGKKAKALRLAEECDGGMSLIAAVEAGKGVALVVGGMAHVAGQRLKFLPLSPALAPAIVGVAYRAKLLTPLASAFLEVLRTKRDTAVSAKERARRVG